MQRLGADAVISADQDQASNADGLVVPGVGAFAACMAGLRAAGGDQVIGKRLAGGRPVLGICVGMQVLFQAGHEHGQETAGVGCWPGVVRKLSAPVLPHMGWNVVARPPDSRLLAGIGRRCHVLLRALLRGDGGARQLRARRPAAGERGDPVVGWTTHGEDFVALVEDGPLMATQFHPEKSADAGAALLANWLETLR